MKDRTRRQRRSTGKRKIGRERNDTRKTRSKQGNRSRTIKCKEQPHAEPAETQWKNGRSSRSRSKPKRQGGRWEGAAGVSTSGKTQRKTGRSNRECRKSKRGEDKRRWSRRNGGSEDKRAAVDKTKAE